MIIKETAKHCENLHFLLTSYIISMSRARLNNGHTRICIPHHYIQTIGDGLMMVSPRFSKENENTIAKHCGVVIEWQRARRGFLSVELVSARVLMICDAKLVSHR